MFAIHRLGAMFVTMVGVLTCQAHAESRTNEPRARNAYFGDLHLHTRNSFDAYLSVGAKTVDPQRAYKYALGEPIEYLGREIKRASPPLDFLAITDHAEWMGVLTSPDVPTAANGAAGSGFSKTLEAVKSGLVRGSYESYFSFGWPSNPKVPYDLDLRAIERSTWQRAIASANEFYRPGKFTTFIGYEWSAHPDFSKSIHRNIIFKGATAPDPFTSMDSVNPEDLWMFLENARRGGYDALAIPHNSNLSNGLMFDWMDSQGRPVDRLYAQRRAANEPLVEIAQTKGQSETRPMLSPTDEFADFELMNRLKTTLGITEVNRSGSYVREGLGRGLELGARLQGDNPFKYGFVGGSDSHIGLSESSESKVPGKEVRELADVEAMMQEGSVALEYGSATLTGVWAEENTRESIFAALLRKETFATSGTRLKVRFFGGWQYSDTTINASQWVNTAYRDGVPMGGELPATPISGKGPTFIVWALKDPEGANLDRLQVVKVWLDRGRHTERVYDVALSNGRSVDPKTGRAPPVGNTVNPTTAKYSNSIGATRLLATWRDPDFDPAIPAVYYLRAIEIPTPRWSTIIAVRFGLPLSDFTPTSIQERGWSSPIWYEPGASAR